MNSSCPECGLIVHNEGAELNGALVACWNSQTKAFDCPRCQAHFTNQDFWDSNHDKHAHVWSQYQGESALREGEFA